MKPGIYDTGRQRIACVGVTYNDLSRIPPRYLFCQNSLPEKKLVGLDDNSMKELLLVPRECRWFVYYNL